MKFRRGQWIRVSSKYAHHPSYRGVMAIVRSYLDEESVAVLVAEGEHEGDVLILTEKDVERFS